jgi:acetoacetyl-CoA reductase
MGRVALVTGGTRGIGAEVAIALKRAGHAVAANYRDDEARAERFHAETGIAVYRWDVCDFDACGRGVARVRDALGPVEILVNNAGITRDGFLHKQSYDNWSTVIRTNLDSLFNMTRQVIDSMREQQFGRIINVSSINGQKGQIGQTNYSAAKAGVVGFTKALAQETARKGITVNVVAPGYIETDMVAAVPEDVRNQIIAAIPVGRLGRCTDIARCVVFLADDEAGFITGSTMTVNGGQYVAG